MTTADPAHPLVRRLERITSDLARTAAQLQFALGDTMAVEALGEIRVQLLDLRGAVGRALATKEGA